MNLNTDNVGIQIAVSPFQVPRRPVPVLVQGMNTDSSVPSPGAPTSHVPGLWDSGGTWHCIPWCHRVCTADDKFGRDYVLYAIEVLDCTFSLSWLGPYVPLTLKSTTDYIPLLSIVLMYTGFALGFAPIVDMLKGVRITW